MKRVRCQNLPTKCGPFRKSPFLGTDPTRLPVPGCLAGENSSTRSSPSLFNLMLSHYHSLSHSRPDTLPPSLSPVSPTPLSRYLLPSRRAVRAMRRLRYSRWPTERRRRTGTSYQSATPMRRERTRTHRREEKRKRRALEDR